MNVPGFVDRGGGKVDNDGAKLDRIIITIILS